MLVLIRRCGVGDERWLTILARLYGGGSTLDLARLCQVCAEVTEVTGAGIMLMAGVRPAGSVCCSNQVSAVIEELQFILGEGPCIDAFLERRPVAETDLAGRDNIRWPAFTGPALHAGARAVFAFPLLLGAGRLGALDLYRDEPGSLTDRQFSDALLMADIATRAVLAVQADAPPGLLAAELEQSAAFHFLVHQASGMIAAQLHASIEDAMVRLRAYAFSHDRPFDKVALDVVERRLRFDDDNIG